MPPGRRALVAPGPIGTAWRRTSRASSRPEPRRGRGAGRAPPRCLAGASCRPRRAARPASRPGSGAGPPARSRSPLGVTMPGKSRSPIERRARRDHHLGEARIAVEKLVGDLGLGPLVAEAEAELGGEGGDRLGVAAHDQDVVASIRRSGSRRPAAPERHEGDVAPVGDGRGSRRSRPAASPARTRSWCTSPSRRNCSTRVRAWRLRSGGSDGSRGAARRARRSPSRIAIATPPARAARRPRRTRNSRSPLARRRARPRAPARSPACRSAPASSRVRPEDQRHQQLDGGTGQPDRRTTTTGRAPPPRR